MNVSSKLYSLGVLTSEISESDRSKGYIYTFNQKC